MITTRDFVRFASLRAARGAVAPVMLVALLGGLVPATLAQRPREFPPALPPTFYNLPVNGGRVHAIAVRPTDANFIIAAHEFGGLWATANGGEQWFHLSGLPQLFVRDVAFAPDGMTVIATAARDNGRDNGGGIWVSRDGGMSWAKPPTGTVPMTAAGVTRTSAHGISFSRERPNRVYVGTDNGVAVSNDNGATWTHRRITPAGPAGLSIMADAADLAWVVTTAGVFYTLDGGSSWVLGRSGSFMEGFKTIDAWPDTYDWIFVIRDPATLLAYDAPANAWYELPIPGEGSRGWFVRVARRPAGAPGIDIFLGTGVLLYKASVERHADVRSLRRESWMALGRPAGLHDDAGDLGVDSQLRPVMYGCDGGLFRPANPEATLWTHASVRGSGMNSLLLTGVSGTNYNRVVAPLPSLYIGTQDNSVWGSPDGGLTWPNYNCGEGWQVRAWRDARGPTDSEARVAYARAGCGTSLAMSDAHLASPRDIPTRVESGAEIAGTPSTTFPVAPRTWLRFVSDAAGTRHLALSTTNLESWRYIGSTNLNIKGPLIQSGDPSASPTAYATFEGAERAPDGTPRIGLVRFPDVTRTSPGAFGEANLIYLPDRGSLGERATMFDWHPIYGVDPRDPNLIIAPDVVNQRMMVSTTGGATWMPDDELTERVTDGGRLLMYDADPYHMQVTEIAFSPYESNLILVGTRDAGVVYSDDRGNTWHSLAGSSAMKYITGFFFTRAGSVVVSTYGRGLWTMDMRLRRRELPTPNICGFNYGLCIFRMPPDPRINYIRDVSWKELDVLLVLGGSVNGAGFNNDLTPYVSVTPGATYRYYTPLDGDAPDVFESVDGSGFGDDAFVAALFENQEVITGVVFQQGKVVGYLTNTQPFPADFEPMAPIEVADLPADQPAAGKPYLSLTTSVPGSAGMVRTGGEVVLAGTGFARGRVELLLDGAPIGRVKVKGKGRFSYKLVVGEELARGRHLLEAVQKRRSGERRAAATFVKIKGEDRFEPQK